MATTTSASTRRKSLIEKRMRGLPSGAPLVHKPKARQPNQTPMAHQLEVAISGTRNTVEEEIGVGVGIRDIAVTGCHVLLSTFLR